MRLTTIANRVYKPTCNYGATRFCGCFQKYGMPQNLSKRCWTTNFMTKLCGHMFTFGSLLISPKIWSAIWSYGTPIYVIADHHALHSLLTMLGVPDFWTTPRKTLYWSHIEIFSPHQPLLPTKHLPLWLLPLNIAGAHLCAPLDLAQVNLESQCTYKIASWLPVFVRLASLKTQQVPKLEISLSPHFWRKLRQWRTNCLWFSRVLLILSWNVSAILFYLLVLIYKNQHLYYHVLFILFIFIFPQRKKNVVFPMTILPTCIGSPAVIPESHAS